MTGTTALLVIDVQVAMFADDEQPHDAGAMLANIRVLLDGARASNVPVIYVRHEHAHYPAMKRGAHGWQIHPAVAPEPNDPIMDKQACDSFYGTPLEQTLRDLGVEHLVITGMQTEMCIDTGCRSALHRDFAVTLVADGHSTWSRPEIDAATIIAHHNYTLGQIPHPTKEIVVKPAAEIRFSSGKL
ncbi:MAG: cysteine hydrolase [Thermomicrobiales bacterium]|nr:cysteine hydrolase [Thermomicrobiales bacterium]